MLRNPMDCTSIIVKLSLQDIRSINNVFCDVQEALKQLTHLYDEAEKLSESNYMAEKCSDTHDTARAFLKAQRTLLDAFADGTYNAGISPFDW